MTGPKGYIEPAFRDLKSIATLGPRGSSSQCAAEHLLEVALLGADSSSCVKLCQSFEEAVDAAAANTVDVAVVANAYSRINELYMRPDISLVGVYMYDTPVYGLAVRRGEQLRGEFSVASHEAPIPLLAEFRAPGIRIIDVQVVSSTSEAARLTGCGEFDVALTNATAAIEYDLEFISDTRPIRMSWAIFAG